MKGVNNVLEISETRTVSKELRKEILGKTITNVGGNFIDHKFTFYYGDPEEYKNYLVNKKVCRVLPGKSGLSTDKRKL